MRPYYGSAMQFYRSLYKDSLAAAGFRICRLTRELNADRPTDGVIQQNIDKAKKANDDDSFLRWTNIKLSPLYTKQTLDNDQLAVRDILRKTDQPGLFAITFPDYLYIEYTKKWEASYFRDIYRAPNMLNYATTIASFTGNNRVALLIKTEP